MGASATLPLYVGGARRARLAQARHELRQLALQRASLAERVEARMREALHFAAGSHPAIELSQQASDAANENLGLVTDAYSQGAVGITELIDAQDAALSADLRAAEAVFVFLIDFVAVTRASGDFTVLMEASRASGWFDSVEAYFREAGVEPLR